MGINMIVSKRVSTNFELRLISQIPNQWLSRVDRLFKHSIFEYMFYAMTFNLLDEEHMMFHVCQSVGQRIAKLTIDTRNDDGMSLLTISKLIGNTIVTNFEISYKALADEGIKNIIDAVKKHQVEQLTLNVDIICTRTKVLHSELKQFVHSLNINETNRTLE
ncbi:hypothetical protein PMAYCL1PPCAC_20211 [Pristionchus mayeri]|uniref:Uncharacterized protein n=1 Tax=Pristionchus mayeri TaxID=1317129 RepID=A0AAN5CSJ2_9BILA|nr:hypothetical protein PMAYCL1PPCAC_20211 [Pristionchus mayeri]